MSDCKSFARPQLNGYLVSQDLNEDDVMVLDSGDEVYVWVGRGSDDQEKEKAFAMAEVSLVFISVHDYQLKTELPPVLAGYMYLR